MNAPGYEITSWSNIWAATVAIQEMCVKQGKIGASKINGMSKFTDSLAFHIARLPWFSPPAQDWLDDFNTAELGKRLHTADIGVSSGGTYKISIALVKDSRSTPAASNIANLTLNTAGGNVTILWIRSSSHWCFAWDEDGCSRDLESSWIYVLQRFAELRQRSLETVVGLTRYKLVYIKVSIFN